MDALPILALTDIFIKNNISWANSWGPLSLLAVTAVLLVYLSLLAVARAFSLKEFEAHAMSEILQAVSSVAMIGFLIMMVNGALDLAHGVIAGEVACHGQSVNIGTTNESTMDEALDSIRCRLQEKASIVAAIQNEISTSTDTVNEFNVLNLQMSAFGITFFKGDWLVSLFQTTEKKRITNNLATVILIGLNSQSVVIAYLKANALNTLIPLGILFRSFYFTRSMGALMLSLGIGMYFLFPVFYVILDPAFTPAPPPPPAPPDPAASQQYCYATMSGTVSMLQTLQAGGLGTTKALYQESIRNELSKSYMELMFHPLIALSLTMVFVRYLMTIFGSDASELMKMVSKVV
ncbi:hypothetical protein L0Y65_00675 [Candidatus Micrarchaeota archaeon]|nr:hypothetical protein [Candidatus Micrarchaeota archaeon]